MAIVKEKLKIIGMAHNNAQVWLAMQMYDCDPNLALDYLVDLPEPRLLDFILSIIIRGGPHRLFWPHPDHPGIAITVE